MDKRTELTNKLVDALLDKIPDDYSVVINDTIITILNDFDVDYRCTEVATYTRSSEEILEQYIITKRVSGSSEKTLKRYYFEDHRLLEFLQKRLEDITPYDIRYYLAWRRTKSEHLSSNKTLHNLRNVLSAFFSWLAKEGFIKSNPCDCIEPIKYNEEIKDPFTAVELDKIRSSCTNIRDLAIVDFLYSTGCRVGEVVNIKITDVNFQTNEVRVMGEKGHKERIVYLTDVASNNLKNYIMSRGEVTSNILFIGKGGNAMKSSGFEALCRRIGERSGINNVHPHRFRHTLATNLLDRGMDLLDVSMILGHASTETTQIYCKRAQNSIRFNFNKCVA